MAEGEIIAGLDPTRSPDPSAGPKTRPVTPGEPNGPGQPQAGDGGPTPAAPPDERLVIERPSRVAWRRFRKHRPGMFGLGILVFFYLLAAFSGFFAPYDVDDQVRDLQWAPPNVRFSDANGFSLRPFVHPLKMDIDENLNLVRVEDKSKRLYVRFFTAGAEHKLLGVIPTTVRLFGPEAPSDELKSQGYFGRAYLMGADIAGRDVFSRIVYGSRVSMTIGLIGSLVVLVIGLAIGGMMGYFGGRTDDLLYSFSQMLMLLPGFYLLLMLRFMFPANMDSTKVYFAVILILSLVGWPSFALVIRGMVKSIRSMDYVQSARAIGLTDGRIIARHVLPNTMGYIVVSTTLRIPSYILGEAALSLLGLGIMEPTPSWGNMLEKARDIVELNQHPWVLWPGFFIFLAVMAFNLVGDGLRDAFDPRQRRV